jgi:hypothetical protein
VRWLTGYLQERDPTIHEIALVVGSLVALPVRDGRRPYQRSGIWLEGKEPSDSVGALVSPRKAKRRLAVSQGTSRLEDLLTRRATQVIVSRGWPPSLRQACDPPAQGREACPGSSEPLSAPAAAFLGSTFDSCPPLRSRKKLEPSGGRALRGCYGTSAQRGSLP